jgi:hypothetical protein
LPSAPRLVSERPAARFQQYDGLHDLLHDLLHGVQPA